jgi:hypothetical protein
MKRSPRDRRCSYLVTLEKHLLDEDELQDLASYLSFLTVADFDVIVIDDSPSHVIERNRRVLRWVARHAVAKGPFDPVRAALDVAACEKVIVADARVRYDEATLGEMCLLLDVHEVVEPQDYLDPLPWWGGLDAGRMLVHRGIDPLPDRGSTFGFRRSAVRGLRSIDSAIPVTDHVRRLASQGAEVFSAGELFVRRMPPMFGEWFDKRPAEADADFAMPAKTIFFFSLLPILAALAILGDTSMAGAYAGAITCGAMALALRGRLGAARFFPWRACFYAPMWVFERSVSVYWALWRRVTDRGIETPRIPVLGATEESNVVNR